MNTIIFTKHSMVNTFSWRYTVEMLKIVLKYSDVPYIVWPINRKRDHSKELKKLIDRLGIEEKVLPYRRDKNEICKLAEEIKKTRPNLILVWGFSQIIPPEIYTIPSLGTVNFHGASLPQYRGANVLNWLIINGETESAATLHYINEGIDTGDIIAEKRYSIKFEDTVIDVQKKMIEAGLELLDKELPKIFSGQNSRTKQDERKAHYYPPRKPKDGEFSWHWPSKNIYNLIRALVKPWPGAFYYTSKGEKVVIDFFIDYSKIVSIQKEGYYRNSKTLFNYLRKS